jgi:hypothetical protein
MIHSPSSRHIGANNQERIMGAFSTQFSTKIDGRTRKYPHNLNGQQGSVSGVDPGAVNQIRNGQKNGKDIVMTQRVGARLARELADGGRISAYEKPAFYAAVAAAKGQDVMVTDNTGHWRQFTATTAGAKSFFNGVRGTKIQKA